MRVYPKPKLMLTVCALTKHNDGSLSGLARVERHDILPNGKTFARENRMQVLYSCNFRVGNDFTDIASIPCYQINLTRDMTGIIRELYQNHLCVSLTGMTPQQVNDLSFQFEAPDCLKECVLR